MNGPLAGRRWAGQREGEQATPRSEQVRRLRVAACSTACPRIADSRSDQTARMGLMALSSQGEPNRDAGMRHEATGKTGVAAVYFPFSIAANASSNVVQSFGSVLLAPLPLRGLIGCLSEFCPCAVGGTDTQHTQRSSAFNSAGGDRHPIQVHPRHPIQVHPGNTTPACGDDAAAGGQGCVLWTILPEFAKPYGTG